jgi:C4-dicarboxylate-specific signal transduction histidine kinase
MMRRLRNIPIQRKLRVVILATCSAALVVACGALFALQFYFFRRDFERDLNAFSEIIAFESARALKNRDVDNANEILTTLRTKPGIVGAALLFPDGRPLAQVGDPSIPLMASEKLPVGLHLLDGQWLHASKVNFGGQPVGILVLQPDYASQANDLFRMYAAILAAVLAISFLVAALISWRLEHLILSPIQSLANTARNISRRNDYSIRAEKLVEDELGSFTDSFNGMLDQIEARDRALRHEIAERKRAEEELQRMQEQLMSASRQAGMAEVATGVLHNVGNVLNSVNVSANLISERLSHSRVANLAKAAAMIDEAKENLADFFALGSKGKILATYIGDLAQILAREREETLTELALLNKNIEHIKDIVARQQSYARSSGVMEPLDLQELVEDAIRMNAGSFDRHGVAVIRDYQPLPSATLDRHKVLEILINILRNAKQAMVNLSDDGKRLTIRIRQKEDGIAEVRITDTGIGIAGENLTKVFSHGFTTRKDGHGFGLHSSAVAAQQMGGRLSADSAGPGTGATFILELPLSPQVATANPYTTAAA